MKVKRYFGLIFLGAVLVLPVTPHAGWLSAASNFQSDRHDDRDRDRKVQKYYDREHKDYHLWDDHERRAYRHWLEERREAARDFAKLQRKEQKENWKWRHEHPGETWERR